MRAITPTIPPTTATFAINKTTAITINNPTSPRITAPSPLSVGLNGYPRPKDANEVSVWQALAKSGPLAHHDPVNTYCKRPDPTLAARSGLMSTAGRTPRAAGKSVMLIRLERDSRLRERRAGADGCRANTGVFGVLFAEVS